MNTLVILVVFYFYTLVYFSFLAHQPWPLVNGALWYNSSSAWIPPTDSLLKIKNRKTILHLWKQKKQNKETKKETFKYCTLFQTTTLVIWAAKHRIFFSIQLVNDLIYKQKSWKSAKQWIQLVWEIRVNFKQCKNHATCYGVSIVNYDNWFGLISSDLSVTRESQKFDIFSIRTSSSPQKVSSNLFWKEGALIFLQHSS